MDYPKTKRSQGPKKYTSDALVKLAFDYKAAHQGSNVEEQDRTTERVYEVIADFADPIMRSVERDMAVRLGTAADTRKGENFAVLRKAGREMSMQPIYEAGLMQEEDVTCYIMDQVAKRLQEALSDHPFGDVAPLLHAEHYLKAERQHGRNLHDTIDWQVEQALAPANSNATRVGLLRKIDRQVKTEFSERWSALTSIAPAHVRG